MVFALALAVHLPAAFLLGVAVIALLFRPLSWRSVVGAGALLAVAAVLRPRLGRAPKPSLRLQRETAPALFATLDKISNELGARPVKWVAFELDYNCRTSIVGLRRERLISIGLPLWVVLNDDERMAMLAHEVAHDVNGDLAHGLVVGSALDILANLTAVLVPPRRNQRPSVGLFGVLTALGEQLARFALAGLTRIVAALHSGMARLARSASPRAEYLADSNAARVVSPSALAECLEMLLPARTARLFFQTAVRRGDGDPWSTLAAEMRDLPAKERERLRRLAVREGHRVDATHPPTFLRIDALTALPRAGVGMEIPRSDWDAIEAEVEPFKERLLARP